MTEDFGRSGGFTLIEIMIAVSIAAIIAVTAFAPLLLTIRSLEDTQKTWKVEDKERDAARGIFDDVRNAFTDLKYNSCRIKRNSVLGTDDNTVLIIWSRTPLKKGVPASVVVYKTVAGSAFTDNSSGLYRWTVSTARKDSDEKSEDPTEIDTDILKPEAGKLLQKDVKSVTFSVKDKKEWVKEYSGSLPSALKITFVYDKYKHEYEDWFPTIQ